MANSVCTRTQFVHECYGCSSYTNKALLLDNYLVLLLPFVETGGLEQQTTQPQFTHRHHISAVLQLSLNKSVKCCLPL